MQQFNVTMRIQFIFLNLCLFLLMHYGCYTFQGYMCNGKNPFTAENVLLKLDCVSSDQCVT